MGIKVNQLASKKAAIASAQSKSVSKRKAIQSKPASKKAAKPKKKSSATVAAKSKKPKKAKEQKLVKIDPKLQSEADQIEREMPGLVTNYAESRVAIHERALRVEKKKLWKLMSGYNSFSAWLERYAKDADTSVRTLRLALGFAKATPQLSAGERDKIGPRKGAKITAAAKTAAEQGVPLDPEILEKAAERTEAEVEQDLIDRGLKQRPEPLSDPESDIYTVPETEQHPGDFYSVPEAGHAERINLEEAATAHVSGEVAEIEVHEHHKSAMQSVKEFFGGHNEATVAAIAVAEKLYANDIGEDMAPDAITLICAKFLKAQYDGPEEKFQDTTNQAAFDEMSKKSGKRRKG